MNFPDIMVDIETGGLSPDHSPIFQIAAVRFNLETRAVDTDTFDRCLLKPSNRYWDEGTRDFWLKRRKVLSEIFARMEDPRKVLEDFGNWVGPPGDTPLRFWGKPSHFDYSMMSGYYRDFDIPNPFHFRYARDMNSFISGLARNPEHQHIEVPFEGDVHNAIFDVFNQIQTLFTAMDLYAPSAPPTLH